MATNAWFPIGSRVTHKAHATPIRLRAWGDHAAAARLTQALVRHCPKRRTEPRYDILSALVHAEHGDERLPEREMLNMLRLLLIAGQGDCGELDRQRRPRAAPQRRRVPALAGRSRPDTRCGRGTDALGVAKKLSDHGKALAEGHSSVGEAVS